MSPLVGLIIIVPTTLTFPGRSNLQHRLLNESVKRLSCCRRFAKKERPPPITVGKGPPNKFQRTVFPIVILIKGI